MKFKALNRTIQELKFKEPWAGTLGKVPLNRTIQEIKLGDVRQTGGA
ncbi:hypothetical protein LZF95_20805 [Algoriphagus sp. AGSA1]|nr:hypothetical protein [Algoriphagus sp. AGSA1]MCE7057133.1 hypothetical protein [Algoriphagus sp. AGSA1]